MATRVVEACDALALGGTPPRSPAAARHGTCSSSPRPAWRVDPAAGRARRRGPTRSQVAADATPRPRLAWAVLAEAGPRRSAATIEAYAYARTGYHRALDSLRKSGWRGQGPVPWSHEPNRGFLRALRGSRPAARAIGESDQERAPLHAVPARQRGGASGAALRGRGRSRVRSLSPHARVPRGSRAALRRRSPPRSSRTTAGSCCVPTARSSPTSPSRPTTRGPRNSAEAQLPRGSLLLRRRRLVRLGPRRVDRARGDDHRRRPEPGLGARLHLERSRRRAAAAQGHGPDGRPEPRSRRGASRRRSAAGTVTYRSKATYLEIANAAVLQGRRAAWALADESASTSPTRSSSATTTTTSRPSAVAGTAVAVANAVDPALDAASVVTGHHREDGVAPRTSRTPWLASH